MHARQLTEKTRTRVEGRCMSLTWSRKLNQDRLRTTWTHATRNGHRPQAHRCLLTKLGHQIMPQICEEHLKLGLWSVVAQGGSTETVRAKWGTLTSLSDPLRPRCQGCCVKLRFEARTLELGPARRYNTDFWPSEQLVVAAE